MKNYKLANGLVLVVKENGNADVTVAITIGVGHNNETQSNLGLCALLEKVLLMQSSNVNAMYGGTVTTYITAGTSKCLDALFAVMSKLVIAPDLSKNLVDSAAADLIRHTKDMAPLVRRQLKLLYKHTAYANDKVVWDTQAYINSLKRFTPADVQAFKEEYYTAKNMVVEVTGNVKAEAVKILAEQYFSEIPEGKKNRAPKHFYTGGFDQIPADKVEMFLMGWDVSELSNVSEANVLMHMLRARLERGFAGTDVNFGIKIAGYYGRRSLQISIQTQETPLNQCLDVVCANIKRLKETLASDRRLESSRNWAMTEKLFQFERPVEGSYEIAWQILGRGGMYSVEERINAIWQVSARNVQEIAQQIFAKPITLVMATNHPHYTIEQIKEKI